MECEGYEIGGEVEEITTYLEGGEDQPFLCVEQHRGH